jgi:hypothetical protein
VIEIVNRCIFYFISFYRGIKEFVRVFMFDVYIYLYHLTKKGSRGQFQRNLNRERERVSDIITPRSILEKPCYGPCSPSLCTRTQSISDASARAIHRKTRIREDWRFSYRHCFMRIIIDVDVGFPFNPKMKQVLSYWKYFPLIINKYHMIGSFETVIVSSIGNECHWTIEYW